MAEIISGELRAPKAQSTYVGEAEFDLRAEAQEKLAKLTGLRLPETRVPAGEALIQIGEESKRKLEHEIDDLPSFADAARLFRDRIKAEDPKDFQEVPVQRVRMTAREDNRPVLFADGVDASGLGWGYTKTGLEQILGYVKPNSIRQGFAQNLLAITDPDLRSSVFNHFAERAHERNKTPVSIRTFVEAASGLRVVRAVTSEKHSLATGDDLAVLSAMSSIAQGLETAKMRITRDFERSYFEVIWPALKREVRVGDIVTMGVRVRNSETKQGALRVEPYILRALCYNFTTAFSKGGEEEITIRHIGDLTEKLPRVFVQALAKVEPFVKAFGDAYKVALPGNKTRGEVLQAVAAAYQLPEATVSLASELWDADGSKSAGDTLAGLVNALTRASQEQTMDNAVETERVAGKLIAEGWGEIAA